MEWGYVYSRCPVCGRNNRILVTFPAFNKPFNPKTHECTCGATIVVSDPHEYDNNGRIIEKGGEVHV